RERRDCARPAQGTPEPDSVLALQSRALRRARARVHDAERALGRRRLRIGDLDVARPAYIQPRHRLRRYVRADRGDVQDAARRQALRRCRRELRLLGFHRVELDTDLRGDLLGAELLERPMRIWFALLVAPLLALADQSISLAAVGWACAH